MILGGNMNRLHDERSTVSSKMQKSKHFWGEWSAAYAGRQLLFIAAVLSDMDAEIPAPEARREKIRSLKQGRMQELPPERIRLV